MPRPRATNMAEISQNRITIVVSAQPFSSKWCCRGAIRNTEFQDNIVLMPKDIVALTRDFAGAAAAGTGPRAEPARRLIEKAEDEYFSRMGWFTRTHPLELP